MNDDKTDKKQFRLLHENHENVVAWLKLKRIKIFKVQFSRYL